ncbi:MAG TPA: outer membrane beta-barrel protein, partial [Bacteroidia bacterium]|nr:outer membrane beta-barrel protein [Bacteroidia bacterium]
MKKIILLGCAVVITTLAFAQNNNNIDPPVDVKQSVFSLGAQGGFGHSYLTNIPNKKFQPSWDAGLVAIYSPGVHWGVELDVRYSAEGVKYEDLSPDRENTIFLRYIRVPLKATYFFRKYENDFRPKISLGPDFGFLTEEVNSTGVNSFDFGLNASIGFHYRIVRAIWFTADVNYYQGLLDNYDATDVNELNGDVRLDLGLSFG